MTQHKRQKRPDHETDAAGLRRDEGDANAMEQVQLLLSEKRTSLSLMRTGIAVFALPLSVLSILIATSRQYDIRKVMHFFVPLVVLNIALIALGGYLISKALARIRRIDRVLAEMKREHASLARFID
jgi:hypothetical protein